MVADGSKLVWSLEWLQKFHQARPASSLPILRCNMILHQLS
jgi:hypothetical protein